ncbi:pilus assembly protein [Steroidobacter sp. S1-65]|uniref:Pilus assembly protein n=1 Tax=Steroidobacter gossypii TaxID=2805490 RepID=A0ABS1WYT0_9GAMM|nr:TadE/TadG family type IV pilus assembly protein [Steroidobacter gossypii]MBM0106077.1 pilus assembly protein [Steroidobacter gossypii]
MNAHLRTRGCRSERGLAMVEFAICIPGLLLLMLATAEIGRVLFQYNTLMKAVRDGARYAATNAAVGTTRVVNITPAVRDDTRNLVVTGNRLGTGAPLLPGLSVDNVTVTDVGNGFVRVAATYTYAPVVGATLPTFGLGAPIDLTLTLPASVLMRAL